MDASRTILRKLSDDPESRKVTFNILRSEHFPDKKHRYLYSLIRKLDSGKIITSSMLLDYVAKKGLPEKHFLSISEEIGSIRATRPVLDAELEYAISALTNEAQTVKLYEGLERAAASLSSGNIEEAKSILRDINEASDRLAIRSDRRISARTMSDLKADPGLNRFNTGFERIDQVTGGGRRGELWLWAAFTAEMKSTALMAMAHHSFLSGKDVLFVSLEMDKDEVRRRLICQHAFFLGKHLLYRDVEFGTFNGNIGVYRAVVKDFDTNEKYGDIQIWEPPLGISIDEVAREVEITSKDINCEICILDYIQQLLPVRKRNSLREEYNETLVRAKKLAMEARKRTGVWLISGYQTSAAGRERAEKNTAYDLRALSETIGAAQIANVIIWSLYTEQMKRDKELKVGIIKSRNSGTVGSTHFLVVDPSIGCLSKQPINKPIYEESQDMEFDELGGLIDA